MATWYHGTDHAEGRELEAYEPGYSGSLGYGVYLTSSPDFARTFGRHIHVVVDPVPHDEVLWVEPILHPCGNSLVIGTPGSSPFTFDVVDRSTGDTHRYSVLEDCAEEVRANLASSIDVDVTQIASRAMEQAREIGASAWLKPRLPSFMGQVISQTDERVDTLVDHLMQDSALYDLEVDEDTLFDILEEAGESARDAADELVDKVLGDEIDLSDMSSTAAHHGYSALHLDGYSPGADELVVFDEDYLPVRSNRDFY